MSRNLVSLAAAFATLALLAQGGKAEASDVKLLYTSAISAMLNELGPAFERASGHRLVARSGMASAVKREIEGGAEFDAAILLGDFDDLIAQGRIADGTRTVIGRTGMAVGVRTGASKPDIGTPEAFRRALMAARTVAYIRDGGSGARFLALLERLGIAEPMKPRLRPIGNTAEALTGEVELLVTGAAPILTTPGLDLVGWLPSELNSYSVFIGGVAKAAKEAEAGRALMRFLTTPAAAALFKAKGVEPFAP